jgi:hypothetical protein
MFGICKEVIYPRVLIFHLAQSRLFANLTLTYVGRTSFDFSLSCLVC